MSEYRQDATTGAWVIVAPERACGTRRRHMPAGAGTTVAPSPARCPFCPGNEHLLAPIIEQASIEGEHGWCTRVVPNRFPALRPAGDVPHVPSGPQLRLAGFGYHEVIIESSRHDADLTTLSDAELAAVVRTWHARFSELSKRPGIEATVVFRNRGRKADTAREHPHSQVIATAIVPPWMAVRTGWARDRFDEVGQCPTCADVADEAVDGRRVVERTRRFLLTVPFAARSPFEVRITPFRHQASFSEAGTAEIAELGSLLQRALARLQAVLGDHAYNLTIASSASSGRNPMSDHWHLTIVPSLLYPGGFEIGSGLPINPSRPEDDAAALRAADLTGQGW